MNLSPPPPPPVLGRQMTIPPPSNLDAEKSLMGSLVADPTNYDRVAGIVCSQDFTDAALGAAFDAVELLWRSGQVVCDSSLLPSLMRQTRAWELLGGVEGVRSLFSHVGAASHAVYYAKEVARCAALRRQIRLAEKVIEKASDLRCDPSEVARFVDSQIATIGAKVNSVVRTAGDIAAESLQAMIADCQAGRRPGVMTGLYTFDQSIGSLAGSELVILAARPSVGKTALGIQLAEHVASKGKPSLVVSLEMRDRELIDRMLAKHSGVNGRKIRSRKLDEAEIGKIRGAVGAVSDLPLSIWAPPAANISQVKAIAKSECSKREICMLVVDYVGLVKPLDPRKPRVEQVSEVSAGLKELAKELDIPVLALCQLNREAETQRPGLHNLRESGSLEQDADMVLFLHKESRESRQVELIVGKNRNGEIGTIMLDWEKTATRFTDPLAPTPIKAFSDFNDR